MTCPKCGGEMVSGTLWNVLWIRDGKNLIKESFTSSRFVKGLECNNCGFLELYGPGR